ncbi:MAG: hypothetical protein FWG90_05015 [Oscillospiraceae bacterium]|nr:hypothetical protein [Oscillospiraceae bacterium]
MVQEIQLWSDFSELIAVLAANPSSVVINSYSPKELSLWDKEEQMKRLAQEILGH